MPDDPKPDTSNNTPSPSSHVMPKLREAAVNFVLGIWDSLPTIAQRLRVFNTWLARKFHISEEWSGRFFKIEVVGLLGGGATLIQLGEYALAIVVWIVLALIWISKVLDWKTISGYSRRVAIVKGMNIIIALAVVTTMIVWTNIKRDEQDWTALQKLFRHNRLVVIPMANNKEYAVGTVREEIPWKPYYTELDVIINNPTDATYEDVNILIRPDYPVAKIAQMSNLSDVSFEDKMGLTAHFTMEEKPNLPGAQFGPASSFIFLATNAGYKVHCGRIPPTSSLRLIMALVDIKKGGKSIPYKPGMVVPPLEKSDVVSELYYTTGESYWFVLPGPGNYVAPRPNPKMLTIDGSFRADNKRERVKLQVPIK